MVLAAKALTIWLAILGVATANGVLREALLIPRLGDPWGLLLSGLLLSGAILAIAWTALPWLRVRRRSQLVGIGVGWFILTGVFELAFAWARGTSWPALLEAYTFKDGNLWPLVLLVTLAAPLIAGRSRGVP